MDVENGGVKSDSADSEHWIKPYKIFLIGLSGGATAAIFPRLITYIANPDQNTVVLTFDFVYVALLFGILVGLAMYWMYQGTSETTRTLFMASLALPSVLSGGINMANSTNAGQQEINKLVLENNVLEQKLTQYMNIPTIAPVEFGDFEDVEFGNGPGGKTGQSFLPSLLGISNAYAQEMAQVADESAGFNPSVQYKQHKTLEHFVIALDVTKDRAEVKEKLKKYKETFRLPNVTVKKAKDTYYIILPEAMDRIQALLAAEELKRAHKELSPMLMPMK